MSKDLSVIKYIDLLSAISFAQSKIFEEKRKSLSFDIVFELKKKLPESEANFLKELAKGSNWNPDSNIITELQRLKEAVGFSSGDTIKDIDAKMTEIFTKIQRDELYQANKFFEMYYHGLFGSQSYLSDEKLVNPVTKNNLNFHTWFTGSKVETEESKPLLVYHGTGEPFNRFDFEMFPIAYFAEKKSYSDWFAKAKGGQGEVFKCYLRILNPMDLRLFHVRPIEYEEFVGYIELKYGYKLPFNKMLKTASDNSGGLQAWMYLRNGVDWLRQIRDSGYFDGFKYYENNPSDIIDGKENVTPAWAVFNQNQIKNANGNVLYSLDSKDMRFEEGGQIIL